MTRRDLVRGIRLLGESADTIGLDRLGGDAVRRRFILICARRIKRLNDRARLATEDRRAAHVGRRRPRIAYPPPASFA